MAATGVAVSACAGRTLTGDSAICSTRNPSVGRMPALGEQVPRQLQPWVPFSWEAGVSPGRPASCAEWCAGATRAEPTPSCTGQSACDASRPTATTLKSSRSANEAARSSGFRLKFSLGQGCPMSLKIGKIWLPRKPSVLLFTPFIRISEYAPPIRRPPDPAGRG
jgi:hypothetical protein